MFLSVLKSFSCQRKSWAILLLCMVFFESCALFFQHILQLPPCVMCIYERIAMVTIAVGALIALINPNKPVWRWLGIAIWGSGAIKGLLLAQEHVSFQFDVSPFHVCDLFINYPRWLPLDQWIPWMFKPYGQCSQIVWHFLSLTMPQWVEIIFIGNIIAFVLVVIAQRR